MCVLTTFFVCRSNPKVWVRKFIGRRVVRECRQVHVGDIRWGLEGVARYGMYVWHIRFVSNFVPNINFLEIFFSMYSKGGFVGLTNLLTIALGEKSKAILASNVFVYGVWSAQNTWYCLTGIPSLFRPAMWLHALACGLVAFHSFTGLLRQRRQKDDWDDQCTYMHDDSMCYVLDVASY